MSTSIIDLLNIQHRKWSYSHRVEYMGNLKKAGGLMTDRQKELCDFDCFLKLVSSCFTSMCYQDPCIFFHDNRLNKIIKIFLEQNAVHLLERNVNCLNNESFFQHEKEMEKEAEEDAQSQLGLLSKN